MTERTLLYSGRIGGKSTFAGGLYSHILSQEDINVTYNALSGGETFRQKTIFRLMDESKYPGQTTEPCVVEFRLNYKPIWKGSTSITVLDFPGGLISDTEEPWKNQKDKEEVRQRYNELSIVDGASPEARETILNHEYRQSDNVIFLLNLYKLIKTSQRPLSFEPDDLKEVAKEKDVAVVATAIDLLNHEPETIRSSLLDIGPGGQVDEDLLERVNDVTTTSSPVTNILNTVKAEKRISFFGVSVPSHESDEDIRPIGTERGGIETLGFENIGGIETLGFENIVNWMS